MAPRARLPGVGALVLGGAVSCRVAGHRTRRAQERALFSARHAPRPPRNGAGLAGMPGGPGIVPPGVEFALAPGVLVPSWAGDRGGRGKSVRVPPEVQIRRVQILISVRLCASTWSYDAYTRHSSLS